MKANQIQQIKRNKLEDEKEGGRRCPICKWARFEIGPLKKESVEVASYGATQLMCGHLNVTYHVPVVCHPDYLLLSFGLFPC